MKYPRLLTALRTARWAITPGALGGIVDSMAAHLRGDLSLRDASQRRRASLLDMPEDAASDAPPPASYATPALGVATITVSGIIGKHLSALETMCGGVDVDRLSAQLTEAAADDSVQVVVLDIDSPGGVVTGVPELAAQIRALGKPTLAFTDTQACSAGYWLAAACDSIVATPTADLGSIGVYIALLDDSAWYAKEGYKLELIKAGTFKGMGMSGQPLADAERALLQADVDAIYEMFTADVLTRRGSVSTETMQGQTFMGARAVTAGLADEIVPDFSTLLAYAASLAAAGKVDTAPNP